MVMKSRPPILVSRGPVQVQVQGILLLQDHMISVIIIYLKLCEDRNEMKQYIGVSQDVVVSIIISMIVSAN